MVKVVSFLLFFSLSFSSSLIGQSDFARVTNYEFDLPEISSDKIYIVADEDWKKPIEVKKSLDKKWKVTGRDARQLSEYLNAGKELSIIDGKTPKFKINAKTEVLQVFTTEDAGGKGNSRIFEAKEDAPGTPKFKNTEKRKRTRSLRETEF